MKLKHLTAALLCAGLISTAHAETISVSGVGKAPITADVALTRTQAMEQAKRDALTQAINKMNGPRAANDPKVQAAIDTISKQIGDDLIADQTASRDAANNFVVRLTLSIDDLKLRQLLQDAGIASTTARNFPILIVMDEFFTTATDKTKPLKELVEYSHDKSKSFAANDKASQFSKESGSETSAYSQKTDVSKAAVSDGYYGTSAASAKGTQSTAAVSDASYNAEQGSSSETSVKAEQKDVVSFKKLVEYQPQNVGPDKQNYTYAALLRQAAKYDLAMIDSDLFKSKYLTGKPLTIEEMQAGREFARYIDAARSDAKADYFMVGSSVIIQGPKNPATGQFTCDGLVTLKAYSTEDGSTLTADARTESASGNSPDQCRVNVANKMANFVGSTVGSTIGNFWRQRETYGREYTISLVSLLSNLPENAKDDFADALDSIKGVQGSAKERRSDKSVYEVSLTYKGDKSISREINAALKKVPGFEKAGRAVKGTSIRVCLEGPCPDKP
jgi:hypothetical protein